VVDVLAENDRLRVGIGRLEIFHFAYAGEDKLLAAPPTSYIAAAYRQQNPGL